MVRWLVFGVVFVGCEGALEGGLGAGPSGGPRVGADEGPGAAPIAACAPPSQLDPGRVTLRRLNRVEYDNTVRDLLDDATRPARAFPADDFGHGFDTVADVLSTAPVLVEQYERAARALAEAVVEREASPGQTTRVQAEDCVKSTGAPLGAYWNLYTNGSVSSMVSFTSTARYTLRVQAAQTQAGAEAATMVLSLDGRVLGTFSVTGTEAAPATYTASADVTAGPHRVTVEFTNDFYERPNDRNLLVDWFEVQRPAAAGAPASAKVMVCDPVTGGGGCVRTILSRFGRRAWRRPLTTAEVDRLANVVTLAQAEGEPVSAALAMALTAQLLSPHFLYRVELDPDPASLAPHPLTDHELAARLSYFLWASTPDEALARVADDGTLSQPAQLSAQVQRMLGDAKARSLVTRFAGQWLWTNQVEDAVPSTSVYANVTAATKTAMRLETEAVVEHFFTRDESVLGLLGGDFTFLNDALADHYGLARPGTATLQRVAVPPSSERGSVLGHAGLLTVTSLPTRTSPVKRGAWVLSTLLCPEPPAPPPGVEGLPPPDLANATLRQRVEAHRANPACAGCHALMDPIGFGLERFDGVGRARATDTGGAPLDVAGVLPDGRAFSGPRELAALLKADPRVPHCLTEKLFTYGLGRAPARDEQCQVDAITSRFAAGGHRFSALVQAIVSSPSFTHRRGELP
jgi:hypothetical protein